MNPIFPPRPKGAIPPTELTSFEERGGWLIQPKFNGSRCVIHVDPNTNEVGIWSRHGTPFSRYILPIWVKNEILSLPGLDKRLQYWLDGELLTKTTAKDTKEKIVLFDVLQAGRYLFMSPNQIVRLKLLDEICGSPRDLDPWRKMAFQISDNLLMSPSYEKDFLNRFNHYNYDEVEGVVLRRKNSALDSFGRKEYEVPWIIRCRREAKNYAF